MTNQTTAHAEAQHIYQPPADEADPAYCEYREGGAICGRPRGSFYHKAAAPSSGQPSDDAADEKQCGREDAHGPHRPLGSAVWCTGFVGRAGVTAQPPRIQLAVLFNDHTTMYYPCTEGWRFDAPSRCIVVGRGVPRTHIPLDQVRSFEVLDVAPTASAVHGG